MDALSNNLIPLDVRVAAANAALELMNATAAHYAGDWDDAACLRYQNARREYDRLLNDLMTFSSQ